ncbi:MAG: hypothetical protein RI894_1717 [Bacteroidota bacterium]
MQYIKLNTLLLFVFNAYCAVANPPVAGKIESVTVYRQGAKLVGSAKMPVTAGVQEVVITDLTNSAVQQSLQVTLRTTGVQLISASYRTNNLREQKVSQRLQELRDSVVLLDEQGHTLQNQIDIFNIEEHSIISLGENHLGGADKGVTIDDLAKLGEYYQKRLNDIRAAIQKIQKQQTAINRIYTKTNTELVYLNQKQDKPVGEITLKIKSETSSILDIGFSILTNNAYWIPLYDLKASDLDKPLQLSYKANIFQTTGYDWEGVQVKVSSGNPNAQNDLPIWKPRFINISMPNYYETDSDGDGVPDMIDKIQVYNNEAKMDPNGISANNGNYKQRIEINQQELSRKQEFDRKKMYLPPPPPPGDASVSVELDLADKQDIASDGQAHLIAIQALDIPAEYEYRSIPREEPAAFLLAKIVDFGKYNLVKGVANLFFGNTYIGQSVINPNTINDTLALSLGRDDKVSIKREKLSDFSATSFFSSTKKEKIGVEITLKNNKNTAIDVEVFDNLPISQNKDLEIEAEELSGAKLEKETGKLTWNLRLKAGEIKKLRLIYTLKYPKSMHLSTPTASPAGLMQQLKR